MSAEIKAKKTYLGDNEDGTSRFDYDFSKVLDVETHAALLTGPISGPITMEDGTQYNVTDFAIGVKLDHVKELTDKIAAEHEKAGTFKESEAA